MLGSCGRRANPACHFVGLFRMHELVLGALMLAARDDIRRLMALGALADRGDTVLLVPELVRLRRVEPGALVLLATGLSGSAAALAVWLEAGRER
jgi:hypothetical protein